MWAYFATADGDVRELANVRSVEAHPTWDDFCVEFDDGSREYIRATFVELEVDG